MNYKKNNDALESNDSDWILIDAGEFSNEEIHIRGLKLIQIAANVKEKTIVISGSTWQFGDVGISCEATLEELHAVLSRDYDALYTFLCNKDVNEKIENVLAV